MFDEQPLTIKVFLKIALMSKIDWKPTSFLTWKASSLVWKQNFMFEKIFTAKFTKFFSSVPDIWSQSEQKTSEIQKKLIFRHFFLQLTFNSPRNLALTSISSQQSKSPKLFSTLFSQKLFLRNEKHSRSWNYINRRRKTRSIKSKAAVPWRRKKRLAKATNKLILRSLM